MKVGQFDLSRQYRAIRREVLREITKVCDTQRFVLAENVVGLEAEIAEYCGTRYAVGVASGTDAILLALMAADVGPGDKVITTPYTFFSTASSIARLGAQPVFVDIHPDTYNIDIDSLDRTLVRASKKVKAIMPVHLFGQCADMAAIKKTAVRYGARVIEDAAQAIGARYKGKMAGSLGDMGCFSFYPSKNLGGFGDGGIITTNNRRSAERLRAMRCHGSSRTYYHDIIGINSRLDEIQAAVLRVKLRYLERWSGARIKNAARYNRLIEKAGLSGYVEPPYVAPCNHSVFNQYVVRVKKRDPLKGFLFKEGISTGIYYPVPLHLQRCFKYLGYRRGTLLVTEKAAKETLALPMFPELRPSEQRHVVDAMARFYG